MAEQEEGKRNNSSEDRSHYGELSRLSSKIDELAKEKENMDKKIKDLEERMTGMSVMTYNHSVEKRTTQMKWGGQPSHGGIKLQKVQEPKPIHGSLHSKSNSFVITPLSEDECSKLEDSHDVNKHTTRNFPYAPSNSDENVQGGSSKDQSSEDNNIIIIVGGGFGKDYGTNAGNKRALTPGGRDKDYVNKDYEDDKRPLVAGGRDKDNLGKGYADNMALVAGGRDKDRANIGYEDSNQSSIPAGGRDKDRVNKGYEDSYRSLVPGGRDKNNIRGYHDKPLLTDGRDKDPLTEECEDNIPLVEGARDQDHVNRGYDDSHRALVLVGPGNKESTNPDDVDRNYGRSKLDNESLDTAYPNAGAIQKSPVKHGPGDRENANKDDRHVTRSNQVDDGDDEEEDDDDDDRLRTMPNAAAIQRMQSRYDAAAINKKQAKHGPANKEYARKEGTNRNDGTLSKDDEDTDSEVTSQDRRDYATKQGNKNYPIGQGSRDYPMGQGSREYPIGQDNKDYPIDQDNRDYYPTGQGSRDYPTGRSNKDYPMGQGSREYPAGQDNKAYPMGQGSREYPTGQDNKDYPIDQGNRGYPVDLGNKDISRREGINRNDDRFNQDDDDMDRAIQSNRDAVGQSNRDFPVDLGNKDTPRKEGVNRNDDRFNQDDDMGRAIPSQDKRDYATSQGNKDYPLGQGSSDYPLGQGSRDYPMGQGSRDYPVDLVNKDITRKEGIRNDDPSIGMIQKFPHKQDKENALSDDAASKMKGHETDDSASTKDSSVVLVRANSRGLTIDGSKVKSYSTPVRTGSESRSNVTIGEGKRPSPYPTQSSQNRDTQIIPPGRKDNAAPAKVLPAPHSSAETDVKTPARCSTDLNQNKDKQTTPTGKTLFRYPTFGSQSKDKQTTPIGLRGNDGSAPPKVFAEFPPYPSALFDAKDPVPTTTQSNEKLSNNRLCQLVGPNTYVCPAPDKIDIICPPGSNPVIHIPNPSRSDSKQKKTDKSVSVSCCEAGKPCPRHK